MGAGGCQEEARGAGKVEFEALRGETVGEAVVADADDAGALCDGFAAYGFLFGMYEGEMRVPPSYIRRDIAL